MIQCINWLLSKNHIITDIISMILSKCIEGIIKIYIYIINYVYKITIYDELENEKINELI